MTVKWEYPFDRECNVSRFSVYYRETKERQFFAWTMVAVSRDELQTTLQLRCTTSYEIAVTAWSSNVETPRNENTLNTRTFGGILILDRFRLTRFLPGLVKANELPFVTNNRSKISATVFRFTKQNIFDIRANAGMSSIAKHFLSTHWYF